MEILAAAEATSMGMNVRAVIGELQASPDLQSTTDSGYLMGLVTSIHEPEESLKKLYLAAIRDAYESATLNGVNGSPGTMLLVDAISKENSLTAQLLQKTLTSGMHDSPAE